MEERLHPEDDGQLAAPDEIAAQVGRAPRDPFSTPERRELARELVRALAVADYNAALYPASHPLNAQAHTDVAAATQAIAALGFDRVTVNIYKNTIFVEDNVMPDESVTYRKLVEDLLARGISAVTFEAVLTAPDATALAELLTAEGVTTIDDSRGFLADRAVTAISLAETSVPDEQARDEEMRENKRAARATYDTGVSLMRDVETQVKLGRVFEVEPLQHLIADMLDSLFKDPAAVLGLTAIKGHDDYTLNHAINVCILSISLGSQLSLDDSSLRSLGLCALLYDLGKVRIPSDILGKQGPLTNDEWQIVKSHTAEGANMLKRIQLTDEMPMVVAFEHHLRHDMQGYPEASDSTEQHLFSRIVALCDAYDAMTTNRPFRRQIRPDKALAVLMQGRGKAYDPGVTKALVTMLGIYPMGAVVLLTDKSTAVVYRVNDDDLLRPKAKRLIDPAGRWLEEPEVIDLRVVDTSTGAYVLSIEACVPAVEAGVADVWEYL